MNSSVLLSPVAEGYVAYDTASDQLHELNPTAALLVELCDGTRTAEDIAGIAAPMLPPDSESAVLAWLETAVEQQVLVILDDSNPRDTQELTVDGLTDLAARLREYGKIQAAFLCQQRAASLDTENGQIIRELGELAHIVGRRDEARRAYEHYLTLAPEDAEIRHLLTSLQDSTAPTRVPDECIQQLYQRFSGFYESNMRDDLGYEGPEHLTAVIDEVVGQRSGLSVLDLGCGTGLAGLKLKQRASRLVGIDLSLEMLDLADALNIYGKLECAEVTDWLSKADENFDLIVACDTFIYFVDLEQVIRPAVRLLNPDGVIAYSVECASEPPFQLTDSGRFVHHRQHIVDTAETLGMHVVCREAFLRMEYGKEVTALYTALSRQPTPALDGVT